VMLARPATIQVRAWLPGFVTRVTEVPGAETDNLRDGTAPDTGIRWRGEAGWHRLKPSTKTALARDLGLFAAAWRG
jgi:hypothetical protein